MSLAASPIQPIPMVMDTQEVASLLRCSPKTVEGYVHAHDLVAIQIGRERRFRADDVMDFITARPSTARNGKR